MALVFFSMERVLATKEENKMSSSYPYGYAGKLLRIDLTEGKISTEEPQPEMLRKFLGGVGYGAK